MDTAYSAWRGDGLRGPIILESLRKGISSVGPFLDERVVRVYPRIKHIAGEVADSMIRYLEYLWEFGLLKPGHVSTFSSFFFFSPLIV